MLLALALGATSSWGSMQFPELSSVCVVFTVVEHATHISTCFPSSTIATFQGCTTTIPGPTCIDTIITSSQTMNPPAAIETVQNRIRTTDTYTTVITSATTFTYQSKAYTATAPTTVTITGKDLDAP